MRTRVVGWMMVVPVLLMTPACKQAERPAPGASAESRTETPVLADSVDPQLERQPPGRRIIAGVQVARLAQRGDTADVAYVVYNGAHSIENFWSLTVEATGRLVAAHAPEPAENWSASYRPAPYPVMRWATLGIHPAPGIATPELSYRALGQPGIVTWYVGGYHPAPTDEEGDGEPLPQAAPDEVLRREKVSGRTVGIVALSATSPVQIVARLDSLAAAACELRWIDGPDTCRTVREAILLASRAAEQGDANGVRNAIAALADVLGSHRGHGVSDEAWWLLTVSAGMARDRL